MTRAVVGALAAPAIVAGGVGAHLAFLSYAPAPWLGFAAAWLATLALTILFERLVPLMPAWNVVDARTGVDAAISAVVYACDSLAGRGVAALLTANWTGVARAAPALWPTGLPTAAQVALAIVVQDFVQYWYHRAKHAAPPLWRLHRVHHDAARLSALNAARAHVLESALGTALGLLTLAALGVPAGVALTSAIVVNSVFFLPHANVKFRLGPLARLVNHAEVHRWHHSRDVAEAECNYGDALLVWDALFGTLRAPRSVEGPRLESDGRRQGAPLREIAVAVAVRSGAAA